MANKVPKEEAIGWIKWGEKIVREDGRVIQMRVKYSPFVR